MCILLQNGTPRRIAFISEEAFWESPRECASELAIEPHISMSVKDMLVEAKEIVYEELLGNPHPFFEPVRFTGPSCDSKTPDKRTNGKGGWIARNRGQKPEYKDRRLRAAGSGKTRPQNMEF